VLPPESEPELSPEAETSDYHVTMADLRQIAVEQANHDIKQWQHVGRQLIKLAVAEANDNDSLDDSLNSGSKAALLLMAGDALVFSPPDEIKPGSMSVLAEAYRMIRSDETPTVESEAQLFSEFLSNGWTMNSSFDPDAFADFLQKMGVN